MRVPPLAIVAALSQACTASYPDRAVEPTPTVAAPPREPATITIVVAHPGASELELERAIVVPLEQALAELPGVARIHAIASAGRATLALTLEASAEVEPLRAALRDRLDAARASLPADAIPTIGPDLTRTARDPALIFTLSSTTATGVELHAAAGALREALAAVPGVGAVEICGGREPRVVVAVDARRMAAHGLTLAALTGALASSLGDAPRAAPGLHITGVVDTLEALTTVTVARGDHIVAVRDVASVAVEPASPACDAVRVGGGLVVLGSLRARRGADAVATEAGVRARLATLTAELADRGVALELPAAPLHLALDLAASATPEETLTDAARALAAALAAADPALAGRPMYVRAWTPTEGATRVDGELVIEATGLAAAARSRLERALDSLPGVRVRGVGPVDAMGELDDPTVLRCRVVDDDLEVARRLAREAAELAATVPGVVRAASRDDERVSMTLELRRERLAALGLSTGDVAGTIAAAVAGVAVGELRLQGTRMPVRVRLGALQGDRAARMAAIESLEVALPAGGSVRLAELVDIRVAAEPGAIARIDRRRAVGVELRLGAPTPALRIAVQQALARSLRLPPGALLVWEPAAG